MHAVPFDAFQQIDMHKSTGPGLERIEHGLVHRNIALDILDPPSRNGARAAKNACLTGSISANARWQEARSARSAAMWMNGARSGGAWRYMP